MNLVLELAKRNNLTPTHWIDKSKRTLTVLKDTRRLWDIQKEEWIGFKDIACTLAVNQNGEQTYFEQPWERFELFVKCKIYEPCEVIQYD